MVELEVVTLLNEKQVWYRLIPLEHTVKSHQDLHDQSMDVDLENDCKTIVTKDRQGKYWALFLRGMKKIDFTKANKAVNGELSIVDKHELFQVTRKVPGTVCPLLLKNIPILIDKNVLMRPKLFFSSGDPQFGLEIYANELNKLIDYQVADIQAI